LEKLDAENIPYKKSFSASTVYVPERRWNDAMLAVKDVIGDVGRQNTAPGSSIWDDPSTKKDRLLREKENALAKTILRMSDVASVDVHIALPDPTPFVRDRAEPKASVVIGPRRGGVFAPEQAATIAALVAGSVEGLAVEQVTVSDLEGHTIYPNAMVTDRGLTRQYQYRRQVEADLAAKAETMLAQMLGPGRAIVRVNADIDFTETERTDEQIDPKGGAKVQEDITSIETKGNETAAAGPAGTASNLTPAAARNTTPSSHKEETIKTVYSIGKTTDTVRQFGGVIKRLTVSALVDLQPADPNATPPVAGVKAQDVEALIKQAVGFDDERHDEITVLPAPLAGSTAGIVTLVETLNRWDLYNKLVRNASLGLAALVALVLGLLLIRKLQPMQALARSAEAPAEERSSVLAELAAQAQQNPELVSKIVAAWLTTPATIRMPDASTQTPRRRAAA
jgi:flagellar M-ring protein FliF